MRPLIIAALAASLLAKPCAALADANYTFNVKVTISKLVATSNGQPINYYVHCYVFDKQNHSADAYNDITPYVPQAAASPITVTLTETIPTTFGATNWVCGIEPWTGTAPKGGSPLPQSVTNTSVFDLTKSTTGLASSF
jgi:hypothetical protein